MIEHNFLEREKFIMEEELIKLKQEFIRIKKMGYVKSTRKGSTGIGKTFEDLIEKAEDALELPDYHGIEIKTKRGYGKGYTTLFNASPKGPSTYEAKRLCNTYGYPDKLLKIFKTLMASITAHCSTLVANRYLLKLQVDYEKQKIWLIITDSNMNILEKETFWNFATLKEKLERKLNYLAFIKAWPSTRNGVQYYKYYDIKFYKLKSFEVFLKLIEEGIIRITFKVGVVRSGEKIGEIDNHGTSFEIQEGNLERLFQFINI